MAHLFLLIPALLAQGNIEGPSMGLMWDGASLRRLSGIPGAAIARAEGAGSPDLRSVVAWGDRAFGLDAGGKLMRYDRTGARWAATDLPDGATELRFSSNGGALAAVYGDGAVRIVNASGEVRQTAVGARLLDFGADGSLLLAAEANDLLVIRESGSRAAISFDEPVRLAVLLSSTAALAATDHGLWVIRDLAGNADRALVWTGQAANLAAKDVRTALIAPEGRSLLVAVDLESSETRTIELPQPAGALARLERPGTFRVTSESADVLWILDWSAAEPRVFFVPALAASAE